MSTIIKMPTILFSEIVESLAYMSPSSRMTEFQKVLEGYIREKYPLEKNDKKRRKCFAIDYYEQIIKSPVDSVGEKQTKIKNIGRSIRRWIPSPGSEAKYDKLDYIQRTSVIEAAFTLAAVSVCRTAKKIEDNGRMIAEKLLHAMGYPDLSASAEAEIFLIFALENGLDYRTCGNCYHTYLKFIKENNVASDLEEVGSTTYFYKYFDFPNKACDMDLFFEKVSAKTHEFRAGSKKITDIFVETFNQKSKEHSVFDTAALFFLMFSTELEGQDKVEIFTDILAQYKIYIQNSGTISNPDALSQWLRYKHCRHLIIWGKKSNGKNVKKAEDGCLFDTFYADIDKCRSKKYETYISREGFIMWLLFCAKNFEEINTTIGGRFPTLNLDSCFDRYATMIADFSYKEGRIHYFDRLKQMEYVVEDDQEYDWIVPQKEDLCQLRASVAHILGRAFPKECRIPGLVATGLYVVKPAIFKNADTEIG